MMGGWVSNESYACRSLAMLIHRITMFLSQLLGSINDNGFLVHLLKVDGLEFALWMVILLNINYNYTDNVYLVTLYYASFFFTNLHFKDHALWCDFRAFVPMESATMHLPASIGRCDAINC